MSKLDNLKGMWKIDTLYNVIPSDSIPTTINLSKSIFEYDFIYVGTIITPYSTSYGLSSYFLNIQDIQKFSSGLVTLGNDDDATSRVYFNGTRITYKSFADDGRNGFRIFNILGIKF